MVMRMRCTGGIPRTRGDEPPSGNSAVHFPLGSRSCHRCQEISPRLLVGKADLLDSITERTPNMNPSPSLRRAIAGSRARRRLDDRASRAPDGRCKVRQSGYRKTKPFQQSIAAVLFPGSQEVWRMWGRERRNSASCPIRQSGAFRKKARNYWGFSTLQFRGEMIGPQRVVRVEC